MVAQLCSDFDSNYGEVNKQLDKMGFNIGMRLVEDFFAKSGVQRCANLRETAESISKVRFYPLSAQIVIMNYSLDRTPPAYKETNCLDR